MSGLTDLSTLSVVFTASLRVKSFSERDSQVVPELLVSNEPGSPRDQPKSPALQRLQFPEVRLRQAGQEQLSVRQDGSKEGVVNQDLNL